MKVMVTLFERNDPMTGEARTFTVGESDDADLPRSIAGAVYEVVRRMVAAEKGDLPFTPLDDDEDDLRARDVSIALGAYDRIAQLGRFEFTDGRSGQAADLLLAKR